MPTIRTAITEMLGIQYPIIAAPMFLVSYPNLVVETSEAGGLGALPSLNYRSTEQFAVGLAEIKARTGKPFGVNLIVKGNPRLEPDLAACAEHGVPLIITSLGDPSGVIKVAHGYGARVFCDVVGLKHAAKVVEAGADALIAVASGAGGHAGGVSPFILGPWLKREFGLPVVAAGGIANGAGVLAALALGCDAAYLGTRFIASVEARADEAYKRAVVEANPEQVVYTPEVTGHPANFLRSSLEAFQGKLDVADPQRAASRAWRDVWSAGHTVGLVESVRPAREIVEELVAAYETARLALPALETGPRVGAAPGR